ncbi:MAG: glycosyltransferase family 2 protein [Acidobacteria bacterium]|nr:glycosyltransferase family 2 protein [Acidobacteriota bacterium]
MVSHNRAALLRRCLEALEASESRDTLQIVVVDNGSVDGSARLESEFPNIRFMRLPRNFGLTKALNIGIRAASADYLFLLHDDTEVRPETVCVLAEALDNQPEAGAVCPLLVDEAGRPAPQVGTLPPDGMWQAADPAGGLVEVNYAKGAAFMFRSFFFRAVRLIDERYGQFGGDAELSFQIRRAGKKILIVASTAALHHGREETSPLREADFRLGVALYTRKRFGLVRGLSARLGAIFSTLFRFQIQQFLDLISGQKIDGTQS